MENSEHFSYGYGGARTRTDPSSWHQSLLASLLCVASAPIQLLRCTTMWAVQKASASLSTAIGIHDPLARPVSPSSRVWLFNNTAFAETDRLPESSHQDRSDDSSRWAAEFVTAYFKVEPDEIRLGKQVAEIAHMLGIDEDQSVADGSDETVHRRIARRIQPFLTRIAVGRTVDLAFDVDPASARSKGATRFTLGPSKSNGISSDEYSLIGSRTRHYRNRDVIMSRALRVEEDDAITLMRTTFASSQGWAIISDIDDTIKITLTRNRLGLLKSTFVDTPQPTRGLPEFYSTIDRLLKPAWFYLSASPYELYPFLTNFLNRHYPEGTMILRDMSWQDLSSFTYSLTEGTREYKQNRIAKIQRWLPERNYICLGDSTQTDPEAYGEMYRRHPDRIQKIYIRLVRGVDEEKERRLNSKARFVKAFEDVPDDVWATYLDDDGPSRFSEDIEDFARHG